MNVSSDNTSSASRRRSRSLRGFLVALAAIVAVLAAGGFYLLRGETSPLAGERLYANPYTAAAREVRELEEEGRIDEARLMRQLAEQPAAEWFVGDREDPESRARMVTMAAEEVGAVAVVSAYNIPHRDCGGNSAGGAENRNAYREWIQELAYGLADRESVVIYEADAVALTVSEGSCLSHEQTQERYDLIREGIETLKEGEGTRVYLDAGHANWAIGPEAQQRLAEALREAGIERADGFALNVSNFQTTEDSISYGEQLSELLGGAHFVIDTSRNGSGPLVVDGEDVLCNPRGRTVGPSPTTDTGHELVDAYLWVKRLGESDGACRPGEPEDGGWWPEYALEALRGS